MYMPVDIMICLAAVPVSDAIHAVMSFTYHSGLRGTFCTLVPCLILLYRTQNTKKKQA